jgi:hypothetical protein
MRPVPFLLHNIQLGRCDVQRVDIRRQSRIRFLGSIRPNEGIDLDTLNVVHLLESGSDLGFGRPWSG